MRRSIQRIVDYAALIVVVLATVFVLAALMVDEDRAPNSHDSSMSSLSAFAPLLPGGHWLGPRDAPAVVLVYSTYACGFCAQLQESLALLRRRYPQHLAVVIKHYVEPVRSAELDMVLGAECAAAAGTFEEYHLAAFANAAVAQDRNGWRLVADSANIGNRDALDECVLSQRYVGIVESQFREATELGIIGTPMLLINGIRVDGAAPTAALDSLIAHALRLK